MKRMQEIETRLSQIKDEIEVDGADLGKLEEEIRALKKEQSDIKEAAEKRQALLKDISLGKVETKTIVDNREDFKMEEKRSFTIDTVEYRNAWLKNLQGKELEKEERAAITATSVIPTQTLNKIVEKIEQTSALYNAITVLNIPGNVSIPVENAKADAAWVAMATAATDSVDTFASVNLAAYKLIKTIEITADVTAMSIDAFESFIVNALYKKMSKAIESAILNGTGSAQPTGLCAAGEITATGTFTKAAMTYKDLMKIIAQLPTGYRGMFVMNRTLFYNEVLGMTGTDSRPVVVADAQAPEKYKVLGYDVIVNDYAPTDTVIFGDLSYYYLNWAKNIEVRSDESVGFRSGSTCYRAMALLDGKKALADAFVKYTRTTA